MRGLIHIYTGEGKGKSTAAVGLSIRCAGRGKKVLYTQFLKDNSSGELAVLSRTENIRVLPCPESYGFYWKMTDSQKEEATKTYSSLLEAAAHEAVAGEYRMLVLDEIIAAYNCNLIDRAYLLEFLKNRPEGLEVVLTGRNPSEELLELADYVSEIRKVKHPYDRGIGARDGIKK